MVVVSHLRMFFRAKAFIIVLLFGTAACQTTGTAVKGAAEGTQDSNEPKFSFFYDQIDYLKELLQEERFVDAARAYDKYTPYYTERWEKSEPLFTQAADAIKEKHEPSLENATTRITAFQWPVPVEQWSSAKSLIGDGKDALNALPDLGLFNRPEFSFAGHEAAETGLNALITKIKASAPTHFADYDHFAQTSFFEAYPVTLNRSRFLEQNFQAIESRLETANSEQLRDFLAQYDADALGDERRNRVEQLFLSAHFKQSGITKPTLTDAISAFKAARDAGIEPREIPGIKIGFIEITSRTLLKERALDFPVEVEADMPIETSKEDLDAVFDAPKDDRPDYLVIMDVALAKTDRRISSTRKMPSRVLVGYKTEPNPEYNKTKGEVDLARMAAQNAAMEKMSADSQYCYGLGCLANIGITLAAAAKKRAKEKELTEVTEKLAATPMTIEVPVFQKYNYDLATVKSRKTMTTHYYVMDLQQNRYFKSTFDINERNNFQVAYRLMEDDPDIRKHLADAQRESDVDEWEDAPSSVKLSSLLDHYQANAGASVPIPPLAELRSEMLKDKNAALANYKANSYEGSTKNDPRFDSVVIIYMPDGGMGSGFYVKPDVVMTNYHVVNEGTFVELRQHDGRETFGKVIAKDIILDLALIKVQSRGKPVSFYNENELELGSSVEVIGHPRGYEFSITRGVVSAVRPMRSINLNSKKKYLQVQIDAPTSPGNSGGPVFMKDKVVSVVSWSRVDKGSENLNFSIHYSEAWRFLKESLGG